MLWILYFPRVENDGLAFGVLDLEALDLGSCILTLVP